MAFPDVCPADGREETQRRPVTLILIKTTAFPSGILELCYVQAGAVASRLAVLRGLENGAKGAEVLAVGAPHGDGHQGRCECGESGGLAAVGSVIRVERSSMTCQV